MSQGKLATWLVWFPLNSAPPSKLRHPVFSLQSDVLFALDPQPASLCAVSLRQIRAVLLVFFLLLHPPTWNLWVVLYVLNSPAFMSHLLVD